MVSAPVQTSSTIADLVPTAVRREHCEEDTPVKCQINSGVELFCLMVCASRGVAFFTPSECALRNLCIYPR